PFAGWSKVINRKNGLRSVPRLEALEARDVPSTLTVTSAADDGGSGTLRAVLAGAQSGDTVVFAHRLIGHTITLTQGQPDASQSLAIIGPGGLTISGHAADRIFDISGGATVPLTGLTLADGLADVGGGILNEAGSTLSLSQCLLRHNQSQGGL